MQTGCAGEIRAQPVFVFTRLLFYETVSYGSEVKVHRFGVEQHA